VGKLCLFLMLYVLLFLAVLDVGLLAVNDVIMELIGVW